MKKITSVFSVIICVLLTGCVSDNDLGMVQSQVSRLNQQVSQLENQLSAANKELAAVKKQRVVRLPTGSPTRKMARSTQKPTYEMSRDEQAYNVAYELYKSGNSMAAIQAFERFNVTYPTSAFRVKSLYYLGQAAYANRDYPRAQQVLETLVYQPINGQVNQSAANLLKTVYQAQGKQADVSRLTDYINSPSMPAPADAATTEQAAPTVVTPPAQSYGNQPLRPSTLAY